MDFSSFNEEQRTEVHSTLIEMYQSLIRSLNAFVDINPSSRMAQKHSKLLILVKEESDMEDEQIPYHLRLSLGQSALKTISVRNLYICERSMLKAKMLNQEQLASNAAITYEKTLQDIRKVFASMAEGKEDDA